ncbi:MAG: 3-oxoadipate enol-lactonase [Gammaproteobacteria bacterium]|nr:MAG: 3-oxoadipate enol-lactonase [Gammaproteobacteria bacterium]UCH39671.1 MAG: 3-oxoadipate enol-lactonase [Gammaproteobacteria bacterium]
MDMIQLGDVTLHYRIEGDPDGAPVVFANSLGTDLRLWEQVIPYLPAGLRILRFDKRGHGLSSCPPGEYRIEELVQDTMRLIEALDFRGCLFVGLSIGGLIAQGLAANHPELLRAMVISNTAARIGTPDMWQERIDALRAGGIEVLADSVMERWFSEGFRRHRGLELAAWRNMLTRTPLDGYIGCSAAVAASDFTESSAGLGLPTLAIAGSEDGSTPPEVVRATARLIAGARYEQIDNAGHLPCVEQPAEYARILDDFIRECGHV